MITKAHCDACGWRVENADERPDECPECGASYTGSHMIRYLTYDRE